MTLTNKHIYLWKKLIIGLLISFLVVSIYPLTAYGNMYAEIVEKLQAALFVKILAMSKEINDGKKISIYVVNSPEAAIELRKAIGRKIGKSTLVAVNEGTGIPLDIPTVIYITKPEDADPFIQYCRDMNVLSMTGNPQLVVNGVTLGVALYKNKPKILLNITASQAEEITWKPVLLKLSKIYK